MSRVPTLTLYSIEYLGEDDVPTHLGNVDGRGKDATSILRAIFDANSTTVDQRAGRVLQYLDHVNHDVGVDTFRFRYGRYGTPFSLSEVDEDNDTLITVPDSDFDENVASMADVGAVLRFNGGATRGDLALLSRGTYRMASAFSRAVHQYSPNIPPGGRLRISPTGTAEAFRLAAENASLRSVVLRINPASLSDDDLFPELSASEIGAYEIRVKPRWGQRFNLGSFLNRTGDDIWILRDQEVDSIVLDVDGGDTVVPDQKLSLDREEENAALPRYKVRPGLPAGQELHEVMWTEAQALFADLDRHRR